MPQDDYRIRDLPSLERVIGEPMEFVRAKVGPQLNSAMKSFIARSPLIFIATIDANGHVDVSPKGDPEGFVEIDGDGNLLIPERLGNRLTFGFRNILDNGQIGLIFVVPNQRETLRVKGVATLHNDPAVLERMQVGGKPALLYTYVEVKECFFHCGKALIRSKLWQPEAWSGETRSIAARQFASQRVPDEEAVRRTEAALEHSYKDALY
ncbi:MSMEG_1061 family FMN-dependent PPOX-type flavoprotein [Sphingomonas cavernae]|uniref:Pyridoxamine 5'-phosphate oxidase family protein n=1 Tax=Sphingomonas cavernae TaxID=2320861 RepID=A0A418WMH7_9SPHN|nr:MSMEG_1061 family FMN-dependent PPOX-type flavoprotein [Sphingomonas cavernae]RJF91195.1 pyridoxamine 5'-phosphate oxidase family protein [Sphingomonas cavernae]